MDELLHQLYHDPKTGYVGAQALYQKAKELNPKITMKIVKVGMISRLIFNDFRSKRSISMLSRLHHVVQTHGRWISHS
ncbi:unnamed protein product [Phytophthora lilii]|uniref:Unnamed protein product n=1 Tax=Phytophthora lilii TaxID=2077276 RepID=A0A9W6XDC0_9STRA|nr:unnamed protein product [Phytophthora lilii]